MTAGLVAALVATVVLLAGGRIVATVVGPGRALPAATSSTVERDRRGRRRAPAPADETAMADWCEHAARSLCAGASLPRALADASRSAPTAGTTVAPALAALDRGHGLGAALATLPADPSTPAGLVVAVLGACADLGGPAARPLDRTAATLHARAAERAERLTASAQARLSARVLTVLPVGTLTLLALAEPSTRAALVTPPGMACVIVGGLANAAGWWWMRRVIATAT